MVTIASTRSDLFRILSFLDTKLPYYCEVHCMVQAALLSRNPCYSVYYLKADSSDDNYSAIVGVKRDTPISKKTQKEYVCWMLTDWCKNETEMVRVYGALKAIDWNKDSVIVMGSKSHDPHPEVLRFLEERNVSKERYNFTSVNRYHIDSSEALKLEIKMPDEVYVKSLERHHAGIVHRLWAFNQISSVEDVADEIDQLPSAGVFLKETGELVAWMTCHLGFGMARLYTLDGYRRRGYASLVVQYMSKRMAQAGYVPVMAPVVGNSASENLSQNLCGFRFLKPANGFLISPLDN